MQGKLILFSLASMFLFGITFGGAFLDSAYRGGVTALNLLGAQVGVSVGVAPNELTKLAQEVTDKQEELIQREIAIAEREKQLEQREVTTSIFSIELYVTLMSFILLLLVLLNFYLDWRRDTYVERGQI